jgi:hypothetical protein
LLGCAAGTQATYIATSFASEPETAEVIEVKPSDLTKDQIGSILLEQAQEVIEVIADNQ